MTEGVATGGAAVSLCRFYAQHGRLTDALRQRLRDLGLYSRARRMCRLSSVGREELRRDAAAAGLAMQLLATNLTYRTHRTAALLSAEGALPPDVEAELIELRRASFASRDMREGMRAFAERRPPRWRGE